MGFYTVVCLRHTRWVDFLLTTMNRKKLGETLTQAVRLMVILAGVFTLAQIGGVCKAQDPSSGSILDRLKGAFREATDSKPYVGRWETVLPSGETMRMEFTSDGHCSAKTSYAAYNGTYVEQPQGILHIKMKGYLVTPGFASDVDQKEQYRCEGGCLITTLENGNQCKWFPADSPTKREETPASGNDRAGATQQGPANNTRQELPWHVVSGVPRDSAGSPGFLKVRAGAGMNFAVITTLPNGYNRVKILRVESNGTTEWAYIWFAEHFGWVAKKYLQPE